MKKNLEIKAYGKKHGNYGKAWKYILECITTPLIAGIQKCYVKIIYKKFIQSYGNKKVEFSMEIKAFWNKRI